MPQWQYLIHETGERAVFDMTCLDDVTASPFRLQCEPFQLTALLAARLAEHPLCKLYFSTAFQDAVTEDERVHFHYEDVAGAQQGACDWLIAADGASSQVRKSLGLSFDGTVSPKTSITLVMEHPFEEIFQPAGRQLCLAARSPLQPDATEGHMALYLLSRARTGHGNRFERSGSASAHCPGLSSSR